MNTIVDVAPTLAIVVVAMGVFGYIIALGFAVYGRNTLSVRLRTWFETAPAQNLGLPSAAAAAFAIVAILLHAFPPLPDEHGVLAFKAFGLEFSGPSGPITLWLMCFMGFVFALKLLR